MKRLRAIISVSILTCTLTCGAQTKETARPEYYIQYIPALADLALPLTGVDAANPLFDRIIAGGAGFVATSVMVQGLKYTVREQRPDGTGFHSFPSGHTSTAFLGAELVRHEYGWGWGAGAYAVATSVAVLRVSHQRHWWRDTVAGAGIGILGANIGYWMLEPCKRILDSLTGGRYDLAMAPVMDPVSRAMCASVSIRF